MKKKLIVLSGFVMGLAPVVALAQVTGQQGGNACAGLTSFNNVSNIQTAICRIGSILNSIIPVLVALGVVYFVYGVVTYVIASDEEAKKTGRNRIIYGIIGLAVIIAVWGLVRILTQTFGVDNTTNIQYPTVPI